jgi:hypothetical protein
LEVSRILTRRGEQIVTTNKVNNAGSHNLSDGATLAIWEDQDGFYWLIDDPNGERLEENVGPFQTTLEAEQDARAWYGTLKADEDPFLD